MRDITNVYKSLPNFDVALDPNLIDHSHMVDVHKCLQDCTTRWLMSETSKNLNEIQMIPYLVWNEGERCRWRFSNKRKCLQ
jgi:hypothetical protein